ncbi:hypothetical protein I545_3531 [Mycobacterium kansasii 662]|uniref:Uncharacterized protein n=2 Tax=Mycobacterium kansasii TaxID=1768 RepID=A0A1V3WV32_MYCKA|nr:hypothetical protein I547_6173 [Mycobacterium kansasii 824]EUA17716.1 hypothetical protein I545_3531 [Mycobacterium kansasii 662]OOK70642.1 hypothetical protein BZL30_6464 [Mycobacterium kansasii]OOK74726.1 hypothetical protein BZL29_4453 [Mycobacterium kansasii]
MAFCWAVDPSAVSASRPLQSAFGNGAAEPFAEEIPGF